MSDIRFAGTVDHLAVKCEDLAKSVEDYHPPHIGLKVETMAELEAAAAKEGRPIKPHRDGTSSFYTKGVDGNIVELIYYPEDYGK